MRVDFLLSRLPNPHAQWDRRISAPILIAVAGLLVGLEAYHTGGDWNKLIANYVVSARARAHPPHAG